MILSDEEIKADNWSLRYDDRIENSHLEANAELRKANARIRELEADLDRWFRDHRILSEAFIRQCDRADRLAVTADALAVELEAHKPQRCNYWNDIERYYDENNYDADGVYLPSPGDE